MSFSELMVSVKNKQQHRETPIWSKSTVVWGVRKMIIV